MKKLLYILSGVILIGLTSCSSQTYLSPEVLTQVTDRSEFSFHATKVMSNNMDVQNVLNSMPGGGASRIMNLDIGYGFDLKPNEMTSALPYFGRLYNGSSYGNNDRSGFTFTSTNISIVKSQGNKGKRVYKITANDQYNKPTYVLEIYKNGSAFLSINSNDRQPISYDGYITESKKSN